MGKSPRFDAKWQRRRSWQRRWRVLRVWLLLAAILAHALVFAMGRRLDRWFEPRSNRRRFPAGTLPQLLLFLGTFWHPHSASMTSLLASSAELSTARYLRLLLSAIVPWYVFWGLLMYSFGAQVQPGRDLRWMIYVYLGLWTAWDLVAYLRSRRQAA